MYKVASSFILPFSHVYTCEIARGLIDAGARALDTNDDRPGKGECRVNLFFERARARVIASMKLYGSKIAAPGLFIYVAAAMASLMNRARKKWMNQRARVISSMYANRVL